MEEYYEVSEVQLSERKREVLALVCLGKTNREIAAQLGISDATVKVHVGHLLRFYKVVNRASLIVKAR